MKRRWNAIVFDYYHELHPLLCQSVQSAVCVYRRNLLYFQTGGELGNYCHVLYGNEFQAYVASLYGVCSNHCGSNILPRVAMSFPKAV